MSGRDNVLFATGELRHALDSRVREIAAEVDRLDSSRLKSADVDSYCRQLVGRYSIAPVVLDVSGTTVDQSDTTMDARQDPAVLLMDRDRPAIVPATSVRFFVPFSGSAEVFHLRPSSYTCTFPRGRVQGQELVLEYVRRDHDAAAARAAFDGDIAKVEQYLGWIANDLAQFDARLEAVARSRFAARHEKLDKDQAMVDKLGFPKRGGSIGAP